MVYTFSYDANHIIRSFFFKISMILLNADIFIFFFAIFSLNPCLFLFFVLVRSILFQLSNKYLLLFLFSFYLFLILLDFRRIHFIFLYLVFCHLSSSLLFSNGYTFIFYFVRFGIQLISHYWIFLCHPFFSVV